MKNRIDPSEDASFDPFAVTAALRALGTDAPLEGVIAPRGPDGPWVRCACLSDPGPDPFPDPDPSHIFD